MSTTWDPQQYAVFSDHRNRPFRDLLGRVGATDPAVVVDLGCGNGPLTLGLAGRWPSARIVGVDSSPQMLEQARCLDASGRVEWVEADVSTWDPRSVGAPIEVIVTNAALQWVPSHEHLIALWVGALAPGGWFAMQVPGNFGAPSHVLLREIAARSPRSAELVPRLRGGDSVGDPTAYASLLASLGCAIDVWESTYLHVLDPAGQLASPVLEWTRGTALRPVLDVLTDDRERADFLAAYGDALASAYPRQPFGTVFPFRRIFAVAHRGT